MADSTGSTGKPSGTMFSDKPKTPKRELIPKVSGHETGASSRDIPPPGVPLTQSLPLFTGGMLVAAEIHDLPGSPDPTVPVPGYKMWSTQTGYVWVSKAEGDAMFAPADEADPLVIEQALKQGLRVVVPLDAGNIDPTTTPPPVTTTMGTRHT